MPTLPRQFNGQTLRIAFFLALILWTLLAGKDVSWDVVNHQLYLPFLWLSGRHHTDLFGAGGQSYQNPLGYFPFYAMVRAGLPAWVIGVSLGALHALVVWPLDRIARIFWPGDAGGDLWCRFLSLAFCCVAPVFLIHEGSSSTDPITALMVIWALALSLERSDIPTERRGGLGGAAMAGALLGAASAIKLSNAVLAVSLCALWLLKWIVGQADIRRILGFGAGLLLAFAVCAGFWMWWLWQDFGNPIFPLYNNVFLSPYAAPQAITALRFVPTTPWGMVTRLWDMAQLSSYVAFEAFLPDARPLLAAAAALAAVLASGVRGGWRNLPTRAFWRAPGIQFAIVLVVTYLLWMRSSGNARYAIAWFMLVGIGLVRATTHVLPERAARVALLTVLVLQGGNYLAEGERRFTPQPWDAGPYVEFRVPARLQQEPFLHLSIGSQTSAALALFVAPGGALANPIGGIALPTTGPLGERFESLLARWHGRTRLLFPAPFSRAQAADIAVARQGMSALLYRIGLDVDWNDCETIEMISSRADLREGEAGGTDGRPGPHREFSCGVLYLAGKNPAVEQWRGQAERVFAVMEAACPRVFSPSPLASEHGVGVWQRHYLNTEALLTVSPTDGVFFTHFRMLQPQRFGSVEEVLARREPIKCPQIQYQTPM